VIDNPNTLLTRFYGLYEIISPQKIGTYFLIMENCIITPKKVHELYDLKGSTINRSVPQHLRVSPSIALKDLDFQSNKRAVLIGQYTRQSLLKQAEEDTKFLSHHNILDYSFLVGIHFGDKIETGTEMLHDYSKKSYSSIFQTEHGGIRTNLQLEVYFYVGIIDILTPWDVSKISEYSYKTLVLSQDKTQLSAICPKKYCQRFMEYLSKIII